MTKHPDIEFDIFNTDHVFACPLLHTAITHWAAEVRKAVHDHVEQYGPNPIKLKWNRQHRFTEPTFDVWFENQSVAAQESVDEIEQGIVDYGIGISNEEWQAIHEEVLSTYFVRGFNVLSAKGMIRNKHDDVTAAIDAYEWYRFRHVMLEHSDVVAYLNSVDANFSYEKDFHDNVRLVVPDNKVAMYLKLAYA